MNYQTIIKDKDGNEHIAPQSHRNMADVRRKIAEAMIKTHNLNCTVEEYWQRCKELADAKAKTA